MQNPFRGLFRSRDKPDVTNAVSSALAFYFGGSSSGKPVNPRTAMQMSTVYACVRVIAETVASLPLHMFREVELGSEKARNHALYRLLHGEPNTEMTSAICCWGAVRIARSSVTGAVRSSRCTRCCPSG